ncbi:hypothetical protein B9Z55_007735 [Caenorhabditis nigoni]|uniref:BTB domain-containing protein n=1 Tax=Caenorhabditis nigoni TaxID=1611254 RepID=A0A2G5VBA4_9PELO|nr:hypothetical protein B9Z55_007735 [Caenorhabditis nigoni]
MDSNNEKIGEDPKPDSQSEKSEILEKLNSHKRKFDEIAEKLQSMEKSILKIPKLDEIPKSAKKFVLKHVFENVANFEEGELYSSERKEHFNANWYMEIKCFQNYIELFVDCEPVDSITNEWSIETKLDYRLLGYNGFNVTKSVNYCFEAIDPWISLEFMEWEDYLIDDNLTVEVDVEILKMDGIEKKRKDCSMNHKKTSPMLFWWCRTPNSMSRKWFDLFFSFFPRLSIFLQYLAAQSSFFKTLFLGNFSESKKSEIPLTGIEPEDFQCFLEFIYVECPISDSTVEAILLIADMYDAPTAIRRCENFLLNDSKKEFKKKLQISTQYRLETLKAQCLSKINKIDDVRELLPGDLSDLDPLVSHIILQKCVSSQ